MKAESKLGCERCGTYAAHEPCEQCGQPIHIGAWYECPHEPMYKSKGFEAFECFTVADHPVTITTPGDMKKYMKPHWQNDHIVELAFRDKPDSHYRDLADRREARREATMRGEGRS